MKKRQAIFLMIDQIEKYRDDIIFMHILRKPEEIVASLVKVGREHADKWSGYASVDKSIEAVDSS